MLEQWAIAYIAQIHLLIGFLENIKESVEKR